jgi:membrane-anchored protein YejM (alkaline phosphatase superfamily)
MWQGNYHMVSSLVPELLGTRYQTPTDTAGNLVGTVYSDWSYSGIIALFFFVVGAVYARAYRSLAAVALAAPLGCIQPMHRLFLS